MARAHLLSIATVLITGAIAATCVRPETERCADGSRCAVGLECVEPADGSSRCAREDQVKACQGASSGSACTFLGAPGTCLGGACFVAVCGDGMMDPPEVCDDKNRTDADGCSSTCLSLEICGNELIDLSTGEQCDLGSNGLAGDGCTSECVRELRLWRDVTPGTPAIRSGHGVVTDPKGGLLMFGGMPGLLGASLGSAVGSGAFNDTWNWDGARWNQRPVTTSPPRLTQFSIAYDPVRRRVVLFGGVDAGGMFQNETWEWDGLTWTKMAPALPPAARAGASFACGLTGCFLFGGLKGRLNDVTSYYGDTWKWDGSTWALVSNGGPSVRWRAAMVHNTVDDVFLLFGGQLGAGSNAQAVDTWELRELTATWTQRTGTSPVPGKELPSMAFADDVGAKEPILAIGSGTYRLSPTGWSRFAGPSLFAPSLAFDLTTRHVAAVGPRTESGSTWDGASWNDLNAFAWGIRLVKSFNTAPNSISIAYDAPRGINVIVSSSETWEWNGTGLFLTVPAGVGAPVPQQLDRALAFDVACGMTVAFGGTSPPEPSPSNETTIYDPVLRRWDLLPPPAAPGPARTRHAMVYDDKRDVLVAFGGISTPASAASNTVLELVGSSCRNRSWLPVPVSPTGTSPPPRSYPGMAFDSRRGVTVVFGGVGTDGAALKDTWEWNGSAWTERTPMTPMLSPSARREHAMAYDPRRKRVVMFAGKLNGAQLADSWEWNGDAGQWERLAPALNPSPRSSLPMAQDVTGDLIAVGGTAPGELSIQEILRLSSETSTVARERCLLATEDLDLDGLAGCADPDCGPRCRPLCPLGEDCVGPHCGDNVCSVVEDYLLCPADCNRP